MANTDPNSKMSRARVIVNEELSAETPRARKDIIARLIDEVGLTQAGAATYYQKLRKEFLGG